jgi:hypothetical protein
VLFERSHSLSFFLPAHLKKEASPTQTTMADQHHNNYQQQYLHIPNRISARNTNVVRIIGTRESALLFSKAYSFLRAGYGGSHPFSLMLGPGRVLYAALNTVRDAEMLNRRIYLVDGVVMGFVAVDAGAPLEPPTVPCYIRLY